MKTKMKLYNELVVSIYGSECWVLITKDEIELLVNKGFENDFKLYFKYREVFINPLKSNILK